jgi:hypothetical protein
MSESERQQAVRFCKLCKEVQHEDRETHSDLCVRFRELEQKVARMEEKLDEAWLKASRCSDE